MKLPKEKLKKILHFFANPHLLLCVGIAWMITNGWSYVMLAIGTWLKITWMITVAGAYLAFLWVPFTPEKLVTAVIAIFLLSKLFPNDKKTLAILRKMYKKAKEKCRKKPEDDENKNNESRQ